MIDVMHWYQFDSLVDGAMFGVILVTVGGQERNEVGEQLIEKMAYLVARIHGKELRSLGDLEGSCSIE
jgi:hypothetical protein